MVLFIIAIDKCILYYPKLKYFDFGYAKYQPHIDAEGFIALFSVSVIPVFFVTDKISQILSLSEWFGHAAYPGAGRIPLYFSLISWSVVKFSSCAYPQNSFRTLSCKRSAKASASLSARALP